MKTTILILLMVLTGCDYTGLKGGGIVERIYKQGSDCYCGTSFPQSTNGYLKYIWIICPQSTNVGDTITLNFNSHTTNK
jgi:hypothetical protein